MRLQVGGNRKSSGPDTADSASQPGAGQRGGKTSTLKARWLEKKVKSLYEDVVNEPMPEDLLKLLDDLERKP